MKREELVQYVKTSLNIEAGAEGGLYELAERVPGVVDVKRKGSDVWLHVPESCDRILLMGQGMKAIPFKLEGGSPPRFNARGVHARVSVVAG